MSLWKVYTINSVPYIIRFERQKCSSNRLTCWLSDFKSLWKETFENESEALTRANKENPLLATADIIQIILDTVCSLPPISETGDSSTSIRNVEQNDDAVTFRLKYYLAEGVPFKFFWALRKCPIDVFFEEITRGLLSHIDRLQKEREALEEIIRKKDEEIDQYKLEGAGPLSRKQLVTERFDPSERNVTNIFDYSQMVMPEEWTIDPKVQSAEPGRDQRNIDDSLVASEPATLQADDKKVEVKPFRGNTKNRNKYANKFPEPVAKLVYDSSQEISDTEPQGTAETNSNESVDNGTECNSEQARKTNGAEKADQPKPKKIRKVLNL